jgi:4-hydroxy-4-methyl-2-oxoglutarate aldolase
MFYIRPMPTPAPAALLAKAAQVEPASVGHFRYRGFPRRSLRPMTASQRIVGTAVTLALPGSDSTLLHHAVGLVRPGDVLVIDRLGDEHYACLGGGVALALAAARLAAVILDGPCTDPAELRDSGLPVWAVGVTALTTRVQGLGGAMNYPVSIAGAVVLPGDLVIADEAGVVFLSPDDADEDLERALASQAAEPGHLAKVRQGQPIGELSGASELVRQKLADAQA